LDKQITETAINTALTDKQLPENTITNALIKITPTPETITSPLELNLNKALALATTHSRELQNKRDTLYKSGLSLLGTRRDFSIELTGTLDYIFNSSIDDKEANNGSFKFNASRIIPTGGAIKLSGNSNIDSLSFTNRSSTTYNNYIGLRIDQPLLAGAGYNASYEDLIQAERDMTYALRDFALERQQFSVKIMRDFYDLLIQKAVLDNTRINVKQSTLLRKRSEAMFKVQRAPYIDVLRAKQQELSSINTLSKTEAEFDIQLRRFLLKLGMPIEQKTIVTGEIPPVTDIAMNENSYLINSQQCRLDLQTTADKVQDAQRKLNRAQNFLRPKLNIYGEIGMTGEDTGSLSEQDFKDNYGAGITLEIPFDLRDERDAVKTSALDLAASIRELARKKDEVSLEVKDNFTTLKFLRESVKIEKMNIDIATKRAANAMFLFKNGDLLNRDVVEAENELLNARNAYVRVLAQYEIQRIELLRNSGTLDIAADGKFLVIKGEQSTSN
jgi:outer membrane protein TolC